MQFKKPRKIKTKLKFKKVNKSFEKKVQVILDKNLENKVAYMKDTNVNYNSGIDNATDLRRVFPNISQGTNDGSRVGDQIRLKRLRIQGHIITNITYNTYSAARIGVRLMVVQPKAYRGIGAIEGNATTWLATLLKKGTTTGVFAGLVEDLYVPINSDAITTYYDKMFYMQSPYIPGTNTGSTNVQSMTKFFDINFKLTNKLVKYDMAVDSGLTPSEFNPVLIVGYAHLDVSAPDVITTQINMSYITNASFQDP